MLDLEIVGEVKEVAEGEAPPPAHPPPLKRLRDSHHAVARLFAAGLREAEISAQTGYSLPRLSVLQHDPSFCDLVAHYRANRTEVDMLVEEKFRLVMADTAQLLHERVLDAPDEIATEDALNIFRAFADRAGHSPVHRSDNRNINVNIGQRLDDAARRRQREGTDGAK